jgi:NADP-dependent aldehyde dehydrogenase
MQRWWQPLGPVAMFSASNFPFAFSVLGGDTASALAAGCPVVVKAHNGHLLLSNRVMDGVRRVLAAQLLPAGLIGLVQGGGRDIGVQLVRHPAIAAAAFTGSTAGGAAWRPRPRPGRAPFRSTASWAPSTRWWPCRPSWRPGSTLAATLAGSIALGCGQFCTNPGVIVLIDLQPGLDARAVNDAFVAQLEEALRGQQPHAMLTRGMRDAFDTGVAHWAQAGADMRLHETAATGAPPRRCWPRSARWTSSPRPRCARRSSAPPAWWCARPACRRPCRCWRPWAAA